MKKILCLIVLVMMAITIVFAQKEQKRNEKSEYVVLASDAVIGDAEWSGVVGALQKKHNATVFYFRKAPREALEDLRNVQPRYVAIVEKPEHLDKEYIMDAHRLSREIDNDIFADYLWGVITGYDAICAMRMVDNSTEPLVIKEAVATIMETNSAKWFDRYGWVDDHKAGLWGEKKGKDQPVTTGQIPKNEVLKKFTDLYATYTPELVITAAHATEKNLEMPFSLGNIMCKNGKLYAAGFSGTWDLVESGKRKIYFAVGNCLIGNVNKTNESMAIAWMNSGNAATMVGYVVETWHGRNGWGGLKYWLTTPGRYSLAEAIYLNQQDFLFQQSKWNPVFIRENYPYDNDYRAGANRLTEVLGKNPTNDQLGFWYDRDVLAYYGDPKWNVRLQEIPEENDFIVTSKIKGKKCIVTIKTKKNFDLKRMAGNDFKKEHVLDIPFSYFFPERLNNPRMAAGQNWKVALDENFLLIYAPTFAPDKTYTVTLDID